MGVPCSTSDIAELDALVDSDHGRHHVPYLALHGVDPGLGVCGVAGTPTIAGSTLEVWPDHGHFPHLVEPQRFLERLHDFAHDTEPP